MKKKLNPVLESMTRLHVDGRTIRVWRTEKDFKSANNSDLHEWAAQLDGVIFASAPNKPTNEELIRAVCTFNRIAAVEVLDETGGGFVLYPDWN